MPSSPANPVSDWSAGQTAAGMGMREGVATLDAERDALMQQNVQQITDMYAPKEWQEPSATGSLADLEKQHPDVFADPWKAFEQASLENLQNKSKGDEKARAEIGNSVGNFIRKRVKDDAYSLSGDGSARSKKLYDKRRKNAKDIVDAAFPGVKFDDLGYDDMVAEYAKAKRIVDQADKEGVFGDKFKEEVLSTPPAKRQQFLQILSEVAQDRMTSTKGWGTGAYTTAKQSMQGTVSSVGKSLLNFLSWSEKQRDPNSTDMAQLKGEYEYVTNARDAIQSGDVVVGPEWWSKAGHGAIASLPYMVTLQATLENPVTYYGLGAAMMQPDIQEKLEQAGVDSQDAFLYSTASALVQSWLEKHLQPGVITPTSTAGKSLKQYVFTEGKRVFGEYGEEFYQKMTDLATMIAADTTSIDHELAKADGSKHGFDWFGDPKEGDLLTRMAEGKGEVGQALKELAMVPGVVGAMLLPGSVAQSTNIFVDNIQKKRDLNAVERLKTLVPEQVKQALESTDERVRNRAMGSLDPELRDALVNGTTADRDTLYKNRMKEMGLLEGKQDELAATEQSIQDREQELVELQRDKTVRKKPFTEDEVRSWAENPDNASAVEKLLALDKPSRQDWEAAGLERADGPLVRVPFANTLRKLKEAQDAGEVREDQGVTEATGEVGPGVEADSGSDVQQVPEVGTEAGDTEVPVAEPEAPAPKVETPPVEAPATSAAPSTLPEPKSFDARKNLQWIKSSVDRRPMDKQTPEEVVAWLRKGFPDQYWKHYEKESGLSLDQVVAAEMARTKPATTKEAAPAPKVEATSPPAPTPKVEAPAPAPKPKVGQKGVPKKPQTPTERFFSEMPDEEVTELAEAFGAKGNTRAEIIADLESRPGVKEMIEANQPAEEVEPPPKVVPKVGRKEAPKKAPKAVASPKKSAESTEAKEPEAKKIPAGPPEFSEQSKGVNAPGVKRSVLARSGDRVLMLEQSKSNSSWSIIEKGQYTGEVEGKNVVKTKDKVLASGMYDLRKAKDVATRILDSTSGDPVYGTFDPEADLRFEKDDKTDLGETNGEIAKRIKDSSAVRVGAFAALLREKGWATDGRMLVKVTDKDRDAILAKIGKPEGRAVNIDPILDSADKAAHVSINEMTPIAYRGGDIEDRVVALQSKDGTILIVSKSLHDTVMKKHPGAKPYGPTDLDGVSYVKDGEVVGVVMPLQQDKPDSHLKSLLKGTYWDQPTSTQKKKGESQLRDRKSARDRTVQQIAKDLETAYVAKQGAVKVEVLPDTIDGLTGLKVTLPDGSVVRSFVVSASIKPPVSEVAAAYGLSEDTVKEMFRKGQGIAGATMAPGTFMVLDDGSVYTFDEVATIFDPKYADRSTAPHEAFHVAEKLGFFNTPEGKRILKALTKKYGSSESIAAAREAWEGPNGLWAKIRAFIQRVLEPLKRAVRLGMNPELAMAKTFGEKFWSQRWAATEEGSSYQLRPGQTGEQYVREFMVDKIRDRSEMTHEGVIAAWKEIAKLPLAQVRQLAKDMGQSTADKQSKKTLINTLSYDMKKIIDVRRRFGDSPSYQMKPGPRSKAYELLREHLQKLKEAEEAAKVTPEQLEEQYAPKPIPDEDVTGIKKAAVNALRALVGLPEMEGVTPETVQQWVDEVAAKMKDNPLAAIQLVNELSTNRRALTERDWTMLQFRYRQLKNDLKPFQDAYNEAVASGDPVATSTALTGLMNARHEMSEFEEVIHPWKSGWGRSGVALQQMFKEDFTLAAMLRRGQEANAGEELDAKQTAEMAKLAKQYADALKELEAEQAKSAALERELASQKQHEEVVKAAKSGRKKSDVQKERMKKEAALWDAFRAPAASYQLGKPSRGVSYQVTGGNAAAVDALVEFYRTEIGVTSFSELMGHVRAKLGDKSQSSRRLFQQAWQSSVDTTPVELPELDMDEPAGLSREARRIQRALVESGMIDREEVIAAVREVMQEYIPDFTKRQTMDALSRYGQFSLPSEEDIAKTIGQMNAEILRLSQLNQLEKAIKRAEELKAEGVSEEEIGDILDQEDLLVKATGVQRRKPHPKLRDLTKDYNDLKKELPPTTEKKAGRLQSTIDARITALTNRIADYEKILASGDFAPKAKKPARTPSQSELEKMRKLDDVRHKVLQKYAEYHLAHLKGIAWTADKAAEMAHLSRALMTSFDMSAVARQGGLVAMGHPLMAERALRASIASILHTFDPQKAMALRDGVTKENLQGILKIFDSRQAEFDFMHKLTSGPDGELRALAGLDQPTSDEVITRQEEAFQGRYAKFVPGVSVSSRQYTMVLNQLRADLFDLMVHNLGRNGQVTLDEAKMIANFVNVMTGRSSAIKWRGRDVTAILNLGFFSPRYVASRFQFLAMPFYLPFKGGVKANWRVKRAIYKEMGRTYAGIGITLGAIGILSSLFWDDDDEDKPFIELDPRSTDFLKVRIGDTRLDFLAGLQQVMVLSARMAPTWMGGGATKSSVTGKITKFGEGQFPQNRLTVGLRFIRTKAAPVPGAITTGFNDWTNVVGQKETPGSLALGLVTPLSMRDIPTTIQMQGATKGTAMGLLSFIGVGMNTFGPKTEYVTGTPDERQEQYEKDLENMKWDSPAPAYSEFLTPEQMEKVVYRQKQVKGNVIQGAFREPDRESYETDKKYQDAVEQQKKALDTLKEMAKDMTYEEAVEALQKSFKDEYANARGTMKPSYERALDGLDELYGK